jgi:hypothetical protein
VPTCSTSTPPSPARSSGDVLEREQPRVVIHDEEFSGLLEGADGPRPAARLDRLGRWRRHHRVAGEQVPPTRT